MKAQVTSEQHGLPYDRVLWHALLDPYHPDIGSYLSGYLPAIDLDGEVIRDGLLVQWKMSDVPHSSG